MKKSPKFFTSEYLFSPHIIYFSTYFRHEVENTKNKNHYVRLTVYIFL